MSDINTGPVLLVPFIGNRDEFTVTLYTNFEDTDSIERIVEAYARDGYKPDLKNIKKAYMQNGHLEERGSALPKLGYPAASAFLRV